MTQQIMVVHQRQPSSCKKVCCILMSTLVFTAALSVFIFGVVTVVGPYNHEKKLKEATCNTTSVSWGTKYGLKCNCRTEYDDKEVCTEGDFPCLNIQTMYRDENRLKHYAQLYQTYAGMDSDTQCSYPACNAYDRSSEFMVPGATFFIHKNQDVLNFASEHDTGKAYPCYYNPSDYGKVVSEKEYTTFNVFNVTFWPLLVMIITIVVTVVAIRACRRHDQRNGVEFNRFY